MRVVIADDVILVREGSAHVLREAGIEIVAQTGDAESLMREIANRQPDIAIVDIRMPPTHTDEGLVAAKHIRAEYLSTRSAGSTMETPLSTRPSCRA